MRQARLLKGAWGPVLLCLCISSTRTVKNALQNSELRARIPMYPSLCRHQKTPPPPIHFSSLNQYYTTIISAKLLKPPYKQQIPARKPNTNRELPFRRHNPVPPPGAPVAKILPRQLKPHLCSVVPSISALRMHLMEPA